MYSLKIEPGKEQHLLQVLEEFVLTLMTNGNWEVESQGGVKYLWVNNILRIR